MLILPAQRQANGLLLQLVQQLVQNQHNMSPTQSFQILPPASSPMLALPPLPATPSKHHTQASPTSIAADTPATTAPSKDDKDQTVSDFILKGGSVGKQKAKKPNIDEVAATIISASASRKKSGKKGPSKKSDEKGRSKKHGKKHGKARGKPHSGGSGSKTPTTAKQVGKPRTAGKLILGCGKCRGSSSGCKVCKNPRFKGVRVNAK